MAVKFVDLSMAKLLKESGYPQKGIYFYSGEQLITENIIALAQDKSKLYVCPTTDELLENLTNNLILQYFDDVFVGFPIGDLLDLFRNPDELAKCWLWLKQEGLLEKVK